MAVKYVDYYGHLVSQEWDIVLRAADRAKVKFHLNSGHRTMAEQRKLFNQNMRMVHGQWVPRPGRPLTAIPSPTAPHIRIGRIDHALDIDAPGVDKFIKFCAKHGLKLRKTVPGEAWHVEADANQLAVVARKLRPKPKPKKLPKARYLMADVSNHQRNVNLAKYKKAGHRVIGLKATEGVGYVDPLYVSRVKRAHAMGLKVVHYHFARPDNHPAPWAEAEFFAKTVKPFLKRGDRVCLDLETPSRNVNMPKYARGFADRVRKLLKVKYPWFYSYTGFIHQYIGVQPPKTRLWLADYSPPILGKRSGLGTIWAHQFTDGTRGPTPHILPGIGRCDVSKLSRRALLGLRIK